MSDSDNSIKNDDMFINPESDIKNLCNNEFTSLDHLIQNKELNILDTHIIYLNNHFSMLQDFIDNTNQIDYNLSSEINNLEKNDIVKANLIDENKYLREHLRDFVNLNEKIKSELNSLREKLEDKNKEISNLKHELNYIKEERNENIYQVKSMLKDLGNNPINIHIKQKNRESISSFGTVSTASQFNNANSCFDLDKLQKDIATIENQLVVYKLKYAENTSKIIKLEDENEFYKKKYEDSVEKLKIKDDIIKSLISERDNLKYSKSHFSSEIKNGFYSDRASDKTEILSNKNSILISSTSDKSLTYKINKTDKYLNNVYLNTDPESYSNKTQIDNQNYLNTDSNMIHMRNGNKTPTGFVKMIKNIFISDKK